MSDPVEGTSLTPQEAYELLESQTEDRLTEWVQVDRNALSALLAGVEKNQERVRLSESALYSEGITPGPYSVGQTQDGSNLRPWLEEFLASGQPLTAIIAPSAKEGNHKAIAIVCGADEEDLRNAYFLAAAARDAFKALREKTVEEAQ